MRKYIVIMSAIIALLLTSCSNAKKNTLKEPENTHPFVIEFEWNKELIEDDYDIEFITDDDGSGYTIERDDGKAVITIDNPNISFDLTYVWLPPVGVLNNLPKCEVKIYENGELKEELSSDNTDNVFSAPTGAEGFGICSAKGGKLTEYSGEWK